MVVGAFDPNDDGLLGRHMVAAPMARAEPPEAHLGAVGPCPRLMFGWPAGTSSESQYHPPKSLSRRTLRRTASLGLAVSVATLTRTRPGNKSLIFDQIRQTKRQPKSTSTKRN